MKWIIKVFQLVDQGVWFHTWMLCRYVWTLHAQFIQVKVESQGMLPSALEYSWRPSNLANCPQMLSSALESRLAAFKWCLDPWNAADIGMPRPTAFKCSWHRKIIKNRHSRMLSFCSWMLLKWMMMTVGSDGMIVSFLCLVLLSRQNVMFAIRPLVQEKYPTFAKILGYLGRGSGEPMQITLVN
jgi:hypothetical protein